MSIRERFERLGGGSSDDDDDNEKRSQSSNTGDNDGMSLDPDRFDGNSDVTDDAPDDDNGTSGPQPTPPSGSGSGGDSGGDRTTDAPTAESPSGDTADFGDDPFNDGGDTGSGGDSGGGRMTDAPTAESPSGDTADFGDDPFNDGGDSGFAETAPRRDPEDGGFGQSDPGGDTRETPEDDDGFGLSERERSAAIGSYIANNPDLVDTGADDPDGGIYTREDIVIRRGDSGDLVVGPDREAIQSERVEARRDRAGDLELLRGAVADTRDRFETEQALATQDQLTDQETDLVNAIEDTRQRFITEQARRQERVNQATTSPIEGAAKEFNDRSRRERSIALSSEQFGEIDFSLGLGGQGDEVESAADDFGRIVSGALNDFGEAAESRADETAENQAVSPPGTALAGPGITEAGGELIEGGASAVGGLSQAPAAGLDILEATSYLFGGTRAVGGSTQETQRRLSLLGDVAVGVGRETVRGAKENPTDFAGEIVAGAALSGGLSLAARGSRLGRVFGREAGTTRRGAAADAVRDVGGEVEDVALAGGGRIRGDFRLLSREFRSGGRDRGQLGGSGFQSENVKTLDDIIDQSSSEGDVEVVDGDQRMLMREETVERERGAQRTAEEEAAIEEMQQEDFVEDLRREEAAEPTAEEQSAIEEMADGDLVQQAQEAASITAPAEATAASSSGGLFGAIGATAFAATGTDAQAAGGALGTVAGEQTSTGAVAEPFGSFGFVTGADQQPALTEAATSFGLGTTAAVGTATASDSRTTARSRTAAETTTAAQTRARGRLRTRQETDARARLDADLDSGGRPRVEDAETASRFVRAGGSQDGPEPDGTLLDGAVVSGFFSETVTAASLGFGPEGRAPASDATSLTGEVPTVAQASGDADAVTELLSPGGGGEIGGSFDFDLGVGGGDA